jgi:prepilin-type N-terminal cleavage/methylation domain-containing protein/prepilin-type processing-associated H-X9-DG protein
MGATNAVRGTVAAVTLFTVPASTRAAILFSDDFSGAFPGQWTVRNAGAPVGPGAAGWYRGATVTDLAAPGPTPDAFASSNYETAGGGPGAVASAWLITPPLTLRNGDVLTFDTAAAADQAYPDRLQVRLNPHNGGVDVGGGGTSVGDFDRLLLDVNPAYATAPAAGGYPTAWTTYAVTLAGLPGPIAGRLAWRYYVEDAGPDGSRGNELGVDNVSVASSAAVPEPAGAGGSAAAAGLLAARRRARRTRGFTLVELLVAIGAVGALLGTLLPAVATARDAARVAACQATLRQVCLDVTAGTARGGAYPANVSLPSPGRFWCDRRRAGVGDAAGRGALACPADEGVRSYAMNVWASGEVDQGVSDAAPAKGAALWRPGVAAPDRTILAAEAWSYTGSAAAGWLAKPTVGFAGDTAGQRFGGAGGVTPFWAGRWGYVNCELPFARHRRRGGPGVGAQAAGRVNLGYADGHVALKADADLVDPATGLSTGDSVWSPGERR